MKQATLRLLLGAIVSVLLVSKVFPSPIASTPQTTVALLTESSSVNKGESIWLGLQFKLSEGWHTYWKNPGDSGLPLQARWIAPKYVKLGAIQWPVPHRQSYSEFMNFGYGDETTLLVKLHVSKDAPETSFPLTVHLEWLVCSLICIPEEATLEVIIKVTANNISVRPDFPITTLQAIASKLPLPLASQIVVSANKETITITTDWTNKQSNKIYFFPDQPNIIENAAIQHLMHEENKLTITIQRKDKQELPQTLGGLISFVDNNDVKGRFFSNIKIDYRESSAIKPTYTDPIYWQLIITICLAFVGGVLLNFMPCVLPVLSIKILSIVNEDNKTINQQKAASYTFGVLITFSSLAIILIVLKALGREIGWGFQLQSPVFVNILLYLMFAIGLNLSGVFSIGDGITALGDKWTKDKGMIGAFFTGMLATIVATPCTAPFMASAIGYALTQNNLVTLLIFLALAIGFSSPFLIITFIPSLEKVIPKPGAWMTTFKQLMAFPMYGASAWLLWIMAHQIEPNKLGFPLSGLILIAFAAWLSGQATEKQENSLVPRIGILIIMLLALILAIASGNNIEKKTDQFITNSASERYSPAKLLTAKSARIPVFINYTAAWCITCKINELTVLSDETVQRTLREKGVLYLKADWTSADPTITRSIESFKRVGIPLYVLYDREGNYRILPQLLRKKTFINTIKSL